MDDVAVRTQGRVAANGIELAYETFGDPGAIRSGLLQQAGGRRAAAVHRRAG
jgi:hypothetical protein